VGSDIFRKHRDFKSAKDTLSASETIRKTHSITVQVTTGAEGRLPAEGEAPYAVCIESQQSRSQNRIDAHHGSNKAMWGYIRYSFLFFIAMVVTWVWLLFFSPPTGLISCYPAYLLSAGPALPAHTVSRACLWVWVQFTDFVLFSRSRRQLTGYTVSSTLTSLVSAWTWLARWFFLYRAFGTPLSMSRPRCLYFEEHRVSV
jgi:hypothetical protein